uniref:Uncharacterized protein n=1 Tax=Rhodnius prolixus TaxID=13249 RepID=T1HSZ0_RHOPR
MTRVDLHSGNEVATLCVYGTVFGYVRSSYIDRPIDRGEYPPRPSPYNPAPPPRMFGKNAYFFIMKLAYLLLTTTSKQRPLCFPPPVSVIESDINVYKWSHTDKDFSHIPTTRMVNIAAKLILVICVVATLCVYGTLCGGYHLNPAPYSPRPTPGPVGGGYHLNPPPESLRPPRQPRFRRQYEEDEEPEETEVDLARALGFGHNIGPPLPF